MEELESLYRKVDGKIVIEIDISSVEQLFNSFDPAPFHEKELDINAENYIVDVVDNFPLKTPFKLVIYLHGERETTDEGVQTIVHAIRSHFRFRRMEQDVKFRTKFRAGRWALLVGLLFVTIAMIARHLVFTAWGSGHLVSQIISDSLLIIGWAAMWEPVTILLYGLWPIIQQKKIYEKISQMEIDVTPAQQSFEAPH